MKILFAPWKKMRGNEPANSAFLIVFQGLAWKVGGEVSWSKTKVFACRKMFPRDFSSRMYWYKLQWD